VAKTSAKKSRSARRPAKQAKKSKKSSAGRSSGSGARGRAAAGKKARPAAKPKAAKRPTPRKRSRKPAPKRAKSRPAARAEVSRAKPRPAPAKRAAHAKPRPAAGRAAPPARVKKPLSARVSARAAKASRRAATLAVAVAPPPVPAPAAAASPAPAKPTPSVKPLRIRAHSPPSAAYRAAMSAREPIDAQAVLAKLRAKKEEILALYLSDLKSGQESNDSPTEDIVDRANNAYSRELNFSISDAERALMLQVDAAIERVESGTYGNCANCGDPIARPRLAAVPWARYCISCQELLEMGLLAEA